MAGHGSIEVLASSKSSGHYVSIDRQGTIPGEWMVPFHKTQYRPKVKWDARREQHIARELRIPVGEYMVKLDGNKEWVRVFQDDVTVVDFS